MNIKNILISLFLVIMFGGCATTGTGPGVEPQPSQEIITETPIGPLDVTFAGFAFLGDVREKEKLYPYSSKLAEEKNASGQTYFNEKLFNEAKSINNPNLNIKLRGLADYDKGDRISLAFAVSTEKTRVQKFQEKYLVAYEVYAQIVIFDFTDMKVIATYPIRMQYTDVLNDPPNDKYSLEAFRKIYGLAPGLKTNIIKLWVERMNSIKPKESMGDYIRIAEVDVPAETLAKVPNKASFTKQAGQLLETFLSANQSVPIVPYFQGGSMAKMKILFVDGKIYSLKLPPADYEIYLKIRPFEKYVTDQGKFTKVVYGSFIDLKLSDPVLEETYLDASFRNIPSTIIPKGAGIKIYDWDEYLKSLQNLFNDLTKQLSVRDSDYFERTTRTKNISDQFKKFMSVIYRVR
jgi:hypothetical protein